MPREVLELGAGISTIVLGHAAKLLRQRGKPCHIVSMEESEGYFHNLKRLLPKQLEEYVTLIRSDVEDRVVGSAIARFYRDKPVKSYDMVFIDGPQVPDRDPRYLDGDLLDVIEWNDGAFTAYLDGRRYTRENLRILLPWTRQDYNAVHRFTRIDLPQKSQRTPLAAPKLAPVA
jgi:hypothetical protein